MSKIIEEEDLGSLIQAIEEKINEEEYSSLELAAAFLKDILGEESEEIEEIYSPEQWEEGRGRGRKSGRGQKQV